MPYHSRFAEFVGKSVHLFASINPGFTHLAPPTFVFRGSALVTAKMTVSHLSLIFFCPADHPVFSRFRLFSPVFAISER